MARPSPPIRSAPTLSLSRSSKDEREALCYCGECSNSLLPDPTAVIVPETESDNDSDADTVILSSPQRYSMPPGKMPKPSPPPVALNISPILLRKRKRKRGRRVSWRRNTNKKIVVSSSPVRFPDLPSLEDPVKAEEIIPALRPRLTSLARNILPTFREVEATFPGLGGVAAIDMSNAVPQRFHFENTTGNDLKIELLMPDGSRIYPFFVACSTRLQLLSLESLGFSDRADVYRQAGWMAAIPPPLPSCCLCLCVYTDKRVGRLIVMSCLCLDATLLCTSCFDRYRPCCNACTRMMHPVHRF